MLRYPGVASIPCSQCKESWYDFIGDELVVSKRNGVELPRPKGSKPPCWKCPKLSPEDQRNDPVPERAIEFSEAGQKAWFYFNEIRCGFPPHNDPLTRRLCGQLLMVEKAVERASIKESSR